MRLWILLLVAVSLAACSPRASTPSPANAQSVINNTTYTKDTRSGLCFSVVFSGPLSNINARAISHTEVPCERVQHLIRQ